MGAKTTGWRVGLSVLPHGYPLEKETPVFTVEQVSTDHPNQITKRPQ